MFYGYDKVLAKSVYRARRLLRCISSKFCSKFDKDMIMIYVIFYQICDVLLFRLVDINVADLLVCILRYLLVESETEFNL